MASNFGRKTQVPTTSGSFKSCHVHSNSCLLSTSAGGTWGTCMRDPRKLPSHTAQRVCSLCLRQLIERSMFSFWDALLCQEGRFKKKTLPLSLVPTQASKVCKTGMISSDACSPTLVFKMPFIPTIVAISVLDCMPPEVPHSQAPTIPAVFPETLSATSGLLD